MHFGGFNYLLVILLLRDTFMLLGMILSLKHGVALGLLLASISGLFSFGGEAISQRASFMFFDILIS